MHVDAATQSIEAEQSEELLDTCERTCARRREVVGRARGACRCATPSRVAAEHINANTAQTLRESGAGAERTRSCRRSAQCRAHCRSLRSNTGSCFQRSRCNAHYSACRTCTGCRCHLLQVQPPLPVMPPLHVPCELHVGQAAASKTNTHQRCASALHIRQTITQSQAPISANELPFCGLEDSPWQDGP